MILNVNVIGILMDLYSIDVSMLTEVQQMQLAALRAAYAPHSPVPPRAVLKVEGNGGYFAEHNTIAEIRAQAAMMDVMYYDFIGDTTRDENGIIRDMNADDDGYDEECSMSGALPGEVFDDE